VNTAAAAGCCWPDFSVTWPAMWTLVQVVLGLEATRLPVLVLVVHTPVVDLEERMKKDLVVRDNTVEELKRK
jgi:hypothetical protein